MHFILGCLMPGTISAVVDARKYFIPDSMVLVMFLYGLGYTYFTGNLTTSLIGAGIGFGIMYVCWLKKGVGGGDLKFATALGTWFGYDILGVLLIGSVLLVIAKAIMLLRDKKLVEWFKTYAKGIYLSVFFNAKGVVEAPKLPDNFDEVHPEALPFGTFLMIGAVIVYIINLKGGLVL